MVKVTRGVNVRQDAIEIFALVKKQASFAIASLSVCRVTINKMLISYCGIYYYTEYIIMDLLF